MAPYNTSEDVHQAIRNVRSEPAPRTMRKAPIHPDQTLTPILQSIVEAFNGEPNRWRDSEILACPPCSDGDPQINCSWRQTRAFPCIDLYLSISFQLPGFLKGEWGGLPPHCASVHPALEWKDCRTSSNLTRLTKSRSTALPQATFKPLSLACSRSISLCVSLSISLCIHLSKSLSGYLSIYLSFSQA